MPERHDFGRVRARHKQVSIPNKDEHPWRYRWAVVRWRVALLTVTHTVGLAMAVALLIASVPLWLTLDQSKKIGRVTHDAQQQRVSSTRVFCTRLNTNTRANVAVAKYIESLIVQGAKQSRVFEPLYRQYGFPPYAQRLRKAEAQAAKLDSFTIATLDCDRFVRDALKLARRSK